MDGWFVATFWVGSTHRSWIFPSLFAKIGPKVSEKVTSCEAELDEVTGSFQLDWRARLGSSQVELNRVARLASSPGELDRARSSWTARLGEVELDEVTKSFSSTRRGQRTRSDNVIPVRLDELDWGRARPGELDELDQTRWKTVRLRIEANGLWALTQCFLSF